MNAVKTAFKTLEVNLWEYMAHVDRKATPAIREEVEKAFGIIAKQRPKELLERYSGDTREEIVERAYMTGVFEMLYLDSFDNDTEKEQIFPDVKVNKLNFKFRRLPSEAESVVIIYPEGYIVIVVSLFNKFKNFWKSLRKKK